MCILDHHSYYLVTTLTVCFTTINCWLIASTKKALSEEQWLLNAFLWVHTYCQHFQSNIFQNFLKFWLGNFIAFFVKLQHKDILLPGILNFEGLWSVSSVWMLDKYYCPYLSSLINTKTMKSIYTRYYFHMPTADINVINIYVLIHWHLPVMSLQVFYRFFS